MKKIGVLLADKSAEAFRKNLGLFIVISLFVVFVSIVLVFGNLSDVSLISNQNISSKEQVITSTVKGIIEKVGEGLVGGGYGSLVGDVVGGNEELSLINNEALLVEYEKNLKLFAEESAKNSEYYAKREMQIKASQNSVTEPPFNPKIYPIELPITPTSEWNFRSCGDGVCASYEDKCSCRQDCGSCPEGTICKRGECITFIPNSCLNSVCEEGENEACPWDCPVLMEEEEELLSKEEKIAVKEKIRREREEFFRAHDFSEEEIKKQLSIAEEQDESKEMTLSEETEDE